MRLIYVILDKYFISITLGFPLFKHRGIRHHRSLLFYFKNSWFEIHCGTLLSRKCRKVEQETEETFAVWQNLLTKNCCNLSKAELSSYMWKNRGHKLTGEAEGILGGVGRILLWVEGWGELVTLLLVFQGMSGLSVLS